MIFIIMSLLNIGPMSFQYRLTTSILFITKYHNYYTSQTYLSKKKELGTFSHQISVQFGSPSQNVVKSDVKKVPDLSP